MYSFRDIKDAIAWRVPIYKQWMAKRLGVRDIQWARVTVMDRETEKLLRATKFKELDAIEISGSKWQSFGFRSYAAWQYPDFDICNGMHQSECCDLVIAEQVFEHILWPYRAARNVYSMLRPSGMFLITTPFLIRIHDHPVDCSRWTEIGIKHLLADAGFPLASIRTASWGNRHCVRSNFYGWTPYVPWLHSLANEPDFPIVVWAFAQKPH